MANYDHGARSDDVRVFDGGEDDEDVEGSRLPLLIVIALLVLAAFAGVVWLAYQRGVAQGHSDVPRVIAAQPGPAKVAPSEAGGTPTPYTGLKIYQQPAPSDADASSDTAAPAATPKPAPAKAMTDVTSIPTNPIPTSPMTGTGDIPAKPAATAGATPAMKPAIVPPPAATKPPPATKPVATAIPQARPPVDVPTAAPAPAAPAAAGSGFVQIGSYKSIAEANAAWMTYKSKHSGAVVGLATDIQTADLGTKGTWYRQRIVTASRADAVALCIKLKAEGGDCIVPK
jgi:hypothetical protein